METTKQHQEKLVAAQETKIEQALNFRAENENKPASIQGKRASTKTVIADSDSVLKKRRFTTEELARLRDKDAELVTGKFKYHESRGGTFEIYFKIHAGDEITKYELKDGQVYSIPKGLAKHLRNNCWYPIHSFTKDENGHPVQAIGEKVKRCDFESLEFLELDLQQDRPLITVHNF